MINQLVLPIIVILNMGNSESYNKVPMNAFDAIIKNELKDRKIETMSQMIAALNNINKHPECSIPKSDIDKLKHYLFARYSIEPTSVGKRIIVGFWDPHSFDIRKIHIIIVNTTKVLKDRVDIIDKYY